MNGLILILSILLLILFFVNSIYIRVVCGGLWSIQEWEVNASDYKIWIHVTMIVEVLVGILVALAIVGFLGFIEMNS